MLVRGECGDGRDGDGVVWLGDSGVCEDGLGRGIERDGMEWGWVGTVIRRGVGFCGDAGSGIGVGGA